MAVDILDFAEDVVLRTQKFNLDMGAKLLTTAVPSLPEVNLVHVAHWVGFELVDGTLEVEVTHCLTLD